MKTVAVAPSWRTIFDAEPCLPPRRLPAHQAGGKMLTDDPDHLLVIIGDHGKDGWGRTRALAHDPDSHMGKLVRVAIETGETEMLTLGHRNPQGLANDGRARGALRPSRGDRHTGRVFPGRDSGSAPPPARPRGCVR